MPMTVDEAIEVLGGLVAHAGGEGDDALDVIKDALAPTEPKRMDGDGPPVCICGELHRVGATFTAIKCPVHP